MPYTQRCVFVASLASLLLSASAGAASLNLLAFGDSGTGERAQWEMAGVMAKTCEKIGCDAALLLGDNIYPNGALSARDRQFQDKFEKPYAALRFPFYVVLGNHDVHLGPLGARAQINYTSRSTKWHLPARHYHKVVGNTELIALDTNRILSDSAQLSWLDDTLAASRARWKIVFGHHPLYSVGAHGREDAAVGHPQAKLRELLSPLLCRHQALYIAGHEHLMQLNELPCGSLSIVSGASAKARAAFAPVVQAQRETLRFHRAEALGFTHLAIGAEDIKVSFWGELGQLLHVVSFRGAGLP
jgi:hypothetical protein